LSDGVDQVAFERHIEHVLGVQALEGGIQMFDLRYARRIVVGIGMD